jgi:hypothetical protein
MYILDPRPYPRLTAEQMDRLLPQVALYFALQDRFRATQHGAVATEGEQLELFSDGEEGQGDPSVPSHAHGDDHGRCDCT